MGFLGSIGGTFSGSISEIAEQYDEIFNSSGGVLGLKAKRFVESMPGPIRRKLPNVDSGDLTSEEAASLTSKIQNTVDSDLTSSQERLKGTITKGSGVLGNELSRKFQWELSRVTDLADIDCIDRSIANSIRILGRKRGFAQKLALALLAIESPSRLIAILRRRYGVRDLENIPHEKIREAQRFLRKELSGHSIGRRLPKCGKPIAVLE